jgi:hypothetical protein
MRNKRKISERKREMNGSRKEAYTRINKKVMTTDRILDRIYCIYDEAVVLQ